MWAGGYEDRDFGRSDEQVEWVGESPKQVPSIFPKSCWCVYHQEHWSMMFFQGVLVALP